MPIPFILAGVALIAGGYGVKKGLDAKSDFEDANHLNEKAHRIFDEAKEDLESTREKAQHSMKALGTLKFNIYKNSLLPFVDCFSKIKNIDFNDSRLLGAGELPQISQAEMKKMKEMALEMEEVVAGGIAALGSGGLAGMAVYGGVGWMAAASTGTAISTLSGAAATNATLAWLGGGSLATGGLGMAGGTMVLGGIVAGPVLAVGGMMLASKAEAAKHNAYSNYDKAKIAAEEMKSATVVTSGIQRRFYEINTILNALNQRFEPLLQSLSNLVNYSNDYKTYSDADKKGVFLAASVAKTIKQIMEAPLMDKNGSLTTDSRKVIELGENTFQKMISAS